MDAIEVGVLGATGMVGPQFVSRLSRHPWFRCTWLAASERSAGKPYKSVAPWKLSAPIPGGSADRDGTHQKQSDMARAFNRRLIRRRTAGPEFRVRMTGHAQ